MVCALKLIVSKEVTTAVRISHLRPLQNHNYLVKSPETLITFQLADVNVMTIKVKKKKSLPIDDTKNTTFLVVLRQGITDQRNKT